MTAETTTLALPVPDTAKLIQYWRSFLVAVKTCVLILAVIGAAHITEPLRADAAVVQPAKLKAVKVVPGKG